MTAQAALSEPYCPIRQSRAAQAWTTVRVSADRAVESGADGLGDHCDTQVVEGRVLQVLHGPMQTGQAVRFVLSQGACGSNHAVNDEFVQPGAELVVLLRRASDGSLYQVQAETPAAYAANEKACAAL